MITCPGCKKTLPDWAKSCQFCGYDTAKVARPVAAPKERRAMATDALPWVWPVYYFIASFFVLNGIVGVLFGVGAIGKPDAFSLVAGGVNLILGIGLIFRLEFIRGVVNVVCFLQMLGAAFSALQGFVLAPLTGPFAALFLILDVIQFCASGFMIFLIGETDKRAPNL